MNQADVCAWVGVLTMIIENIKPFVGQHCETTATGTLLNHLGITLSEPMLFGLGEGLGFVYWNAKAMPFPFVGGRVKPDVLTENLCRTLGLGLEVTQTTSKKKAWDRVSQAIEQGRPVGLKLDCYHLDYFTKKIHFAAHYVAMYGFDAASAYLVDTAPQGSRVKTSRSSLALARSERGPMSSNNLTYTISAPDKRLDPAQVARAAIGRNAHDYLNPPIQNFGYKGVRKAGRELLKQYDLGEIERRALQTTAMLMERGGTGGAMFRNLYRDFLYEIAELLGDDHIREAGERFAQIAQQWTAVSVLLEDAAESGDRDKMLEAARLLTELSEQEHEVMKALQSRCG